MGRSSGGAGIPYYPKDSDHTSHKKIRLLFFEFQEREGGRGGDAYWVLNCLWDWIYKNKGYYFDPSDTEDMLLFTNEHCKMNLEFVQKVILSCVRLKIFDPKIYNSTGVLTSHRIQVNYLDATAARKKKGARIVINRRFYCIEIERTNLFSREKLFKHTLTDELKPLVPWIIEHFPEKIEFFPGLDRDRDRDREYILPENGVSGGNRNLFSQVPPEEEKPNAAVAPPTPPPSSDESEKKKTSPRRAAKKPEDVTPFWNEMKEVFNQFVRMNYDGKKFSWDTVQGANMAKLLKELKKRAEDEGKEWGLGLATLRWNEFLSTAIMDTWLHDHFDINNLYSKRNQIFLSSPKTLTNATTNAHQGHNTASDERSRKTSSGKSAGAAALADELKERIAGDRYD